MPPLTRIRHPALHALRFGRRKHFCAAKRANLLVRTLDHSVAFARLARLDLAVRSEPKALFSARFRFHFGHFASPRAKAAPWAASKNRHGSPLAGRFRAAR